MDRRTALRNTGLLIGTAVSSSSLMVLLDSCQSASQSNWKPEFLTADEAKFISTLVDMILPRTDTPGALDVKADVFIDKVFAQVYDEAGQKQVRLDIKAFNDDCKKNHGDVFANLSNEDKVSVLKAAEKTSGKFGYGIWGKGVGEQAPVGFYRNMKSMAIWAYFTAQKIGEEVLNYDPIPGVYQGCIPVKEVGNRYSL
jgi:hypothetical protein